VKGHDFSRAEKVDAPPSSLPQAGMESEARNDKKKRLLFLRSAELRAGLRQRNWTIDPSMARLKSCPFTYLVYYCAGLVMARLTYAKIKSCDWTSPLARQSVEH
jgi:hypothetical protein